MKNPSNHAIPEWARHAIWYQIFPERFRNGAPQSNPGPADTGYRDSGSWRTTPWGHDWYARDPWTHEDDEFYRYVYHRRYGGDLVGVHEKLGYLQDLGVTAIYFNPLFTGRSLHKYDGSTFHHIDPTFGPDRDGDVAALAEAGETEDPATWIWTQADRYFLELVTACHRRGMRVIIDGVFNHTGRDFFAFRDLLQNGSGSPYLDWYKIDQWHDDKHFSYAGWFGHKALPEFAQEGDNLARPVRDYIFHITRRWMQPDGAAGHLDGIDGWRLDVAYCVPLGFWREWRAWVKGLNPEAYTTAEIVERADAYLRGDTFDAVMNYMWLYAAVGFFAPDPRALSAQQLRGKLDELREAYPAITQPVLQNLLDSHDVARILTMLENPALPKASWDDYFEATRAKHHPELVTRRPGPDAVRALQQLVIFQMTYVGAPMIYYGTEVGMWGANDPDNRQPMMWDDMDYDPEQWSHTGLSTPTPRGPDTALRAFFQRAIGLRKANPALRTAELKWLNSGHERLLAYERTDGEQDITVMINTSDSDLSCGCRHVGRDLWAESKRVTSPVLVPARGWRILERVSG